MGTTITVRQATEEDIDVIQEIARQSWSKAYEGVLEEDVVEAMLEGGYSRANLEEMIGSGDVGLFVATIGGEIVGYADSDPREGGEEGRISIYVSPDHWGDGVGTRLLERTEHYLSEQGVERMRDSVLVENEIGNAFYSKHFEKTGEKELDIAGETYSANVYSGPVT
jgi:ribosomal protein S18 acetylase RimI-like enzyme